MFKKPKNLALSSAVIVGGIMLADNFKEEKKRLQLFRIAQSSVRISNLLRTTSIMVADYVYFYRLNSSIQVDSSYDENMQKLQEQQNLIEYYTIEQIRSIEHSEKKKWLKLVNLTRNKMDIITSYLEKISNKDKVLSELHRRNAKRLRKMCESNRGVYIKLGQHLAMLDHILPHEYQIELSALLSQNPITPWESVRRVIKDDLGRYPEELFQSIDHEPIASASLAQVHIAYGKKGEKLAIKVQHDGLYEGSQGDMMVITYLVETLSNLFKDFNYSWLTKEMNRNLPLELDFVHEAKNIERCQSCLQSLIQHGDVSVPYVLKNCSSRRVLTMGFEEGCYVTDMQRIKELKLNPYQISNMISKIFCLQIYKHGFVHCDPHDANILVRPHPFIKGRSQIVLLDHGLYRELDDSFRRNYCRLWQAIILADEIGIETYCRVLNAGGAYTLLAAMLTMRPWDDIVSQDINRLKTKGTEADSLMLKMYAQKYFREIVKLLGSVPSDLLLLFKTNDCLRHLDKGLGTPLNSATVIAEVTSDVILQEDFHEYVQQISINYFNLSFMASSTIQFIQKNIKWLKLYTRLLGLKIFLFYKTSVQLIQNQLAFH